MLRMLFPATVDNTYRGHKFALWLFAFVVFVKVAQIASVMIDAPGMVTSADGIPLETFSPPAVQTVLAAFIGMGVSRLLICVVCAVVLLRYRSVLTATFALLALHDIARELVLQQVRTGTPIGPYVNWALLVLTLVGLALSIGSGRLESARAPV